MFFFSSMKHHGSFRMRHFSGTKSGSGYADKDKSKEDKWKDDDDDKPAPPKAGTGGVDVSADGGAIVATRCAYEGAGIVKQMSEEKIVSQLRTDVSAAFG